jgi:hypothetical protein
MRYIAGSIYKRTRRVISLNVVYVLMFNSDSTKHVCTRERESGEGALVTLRGASGHTKLRAPESHCYVMHMCTNRTCNILSIHMNISVCVK